MKQSVLFDALLIKVFLNEPKSSLNFSFIEPIFFHWSAVQKNQFQLHSTDLGIMVLCEYCNLEKTVGKYVLLLLFHMKKVKY